MTYRQKKKTQWKKGDKPPFPASTYNMGDGESSNYDEPNPKNLYQPQATWKNRREDQLSANSMMS